MEIGDRLTVIDDVNGEVSGIVVGFNHENYPIVRFDSSTVIIFPDMIKNGG